MKKNKLFYVAAFFFFTSLFFLFNSYQLIRKQKAIKKELKETNLLYDENIQYNIKLEDSLSRLNKELDELKASDLFSLEGNPKSIQYLNKSFDEERKDWSSYILKELYKTNETKGNNPLVPFDGMDGPMKIDRAKVLNNRWILAHFTDGTYEGEMILRYDVDNNKKISFKVLDETLHP